MTSILNKLEFLFQKIDIWEREFMYCVFMTLFSSLFFTVLPHLEYKWKLLTKVFKTQTRAADALAFLMINIASYRFYSFIECIFNQEKIILNSGWLMFLSAIGAFLILSGSILILTSFKHLGLRGMYFGDHFGFKLKKKISQFPYDKIETPQYTGEKMIYIGIALAYASPAGLCLTINFFLCTEIIFQVEKRKLNIFYPVEE